MQYPVPQFTDVEDKIIGSLTIKQFGILFGVGVVVFLAYSLTKSILVMVFFFVLFGLPGLGLALVPFNGRPIYNVIGVLIKFISSPKVLVFHKEASSLGGAKLKNVEIKAPVVASTEVVLSPQANLRKVQELLRNTSREEVQITKETKNRI